MPPKAGERKTKRRAHHHRHVHLRRLYYQSKSWDGSSIRPSLDGWLSLISSALCFLQFSHIIYIEARDQIWRRGSGRVILFPVTARKSTVFASAISPVTMQKWVVHLPPVEEQQWFHAPPFRSPDVAKWGLLGEECKTRVLHPPPDITSTKNASIAAPSSNNWNYCYYYLSKTIFHAPWVDVTMFIGSWIGCY